MTSNWLDTIDYPFASNDLEVDGGRLHYVDEGEGEPLLMVHGQPTWSFMYRHLIRGLSPRYRCIAVDLIGFGLSDKPRSWSYAPHAHAENLETLVKHLGIEPLNLVVHDWGGPIGLGWASAHRDRVKRIIALDTWMWSMGEHLAGRWFSRVMGSSMGQFTTRRFNVFVEWFMKSALGKHWPDVERAYRGPMLDPDDRQGCALFPRKLCDPWLEEIWERRAVLSDVPAKLIWGGADPAFRPVMRDRLASVFDHHELEVFDGVGHFIAEELGEKLVASVERFLQSPA